MPLRSSSAIAGISNAAARCIRNSGIDAPSRNENADRACSSTYSVIRPLHIPAAGTRIKGNAAHALHALGYQSHIPLFAAPVGLRPPLPTHTPRPSDLADGITLPVPKDACWYAASEHNADGLRRAADAERRRYRKSGSFASLRWWWCERNHTEGVRTMI